MRKVVVGLSGGVDSSVAAYLLKEQGYDVTGLFMVNWHDTAGTLSGSCPWEDDIIVARLVARKLGIAFHDVDLSEPYRKRVVDYMFAEYQLGRTPNPDVLCNREIKFDLFIREAERLGADLVATGHYCRKETFSSGGRDVHRLLAGVDPGKDQSYFLCQLSQEQLSKALFPIGGLMKARVREIADNLRLPTALKKDSQGICFVGKVDLPAFLQQKLAPRNGRIIEIPAGSDIYIRPPDQEEHGEIEAKTRAWAYSSTAGRIVGEHRGAHFFTIGQRKGLNVGGTKRPLFVIATDVRENIVYVGQGEDHPGLFRQGLFIPSGDVHWVRPDLRPEGGSTVNYLARIRYRQSLQKASLHVTGKGIHLVFSRPQRGITSGQFAAWYTGEELIGSGVIS